MKSLSLLFVSFLLPVALAAKDSYRTKSYRSYAPRQSNVSSSYKMGNTSFTTYRNGTTRTTHKVGDTTFYNYSNGTRGTVRKTGNAVNYNFSIPGKSRTTNMTTYYW